MESFNQFRLPGSVLRALASLQFAQPTPIQAKAIPVALSKRDIIGIAQTGTGKTGAFCVPIITHLIANPHKTALILVPTRELALQIDIFWKKLTKSIPNMRSAVIIGGASMNPQLRDLRNKPRFIVATPGRLVDHLARRTVVVSNIDTLVLDEADRMLDMGFAPQLNQIMNCIPRTRQTLLFSATWASELDQLSKKYLINPERITIGAISRTAADVTQTLVWTTNQKKDNALLDQLNQFPGSTLIFARTKSRTDRVARYLSSYGVEVNRLHGGRSQGQRNLALHAFRTGQIRVLVATDIAARGLDVTDIAHVVNYDLPRSSEDYVHRIGRTGRAGKSGRASSLITPEDRGQWKQIEMLLKRSGSQIPTALVR